MAKVSQVIGWLSERDPEETIALQGWWYKSDVENNFYVKLTDEQWHYIVNRFEKDTDVPMSEVMYMAKERFDIQETDEEGEIIDEEEGVF
jgi:hypothetical protein